jgi:hypothetical protein
LNARRAAPLLGAILLAWIPYRAFFTTQVPVGRDLLYYFYPIKAHLAEAAARGEVPWLDRFRWGGAPLLGSPSAAAFHPANALFLVLPLGVAMKAWILLHLALLVAGFAAFVRRLGLGNEMAAVAGLLYALAGTTVSVMPFPSTLAALALLPWFAAFTLDTVRAPSARAAVRAGSAAGLILLAWSPELAVYAFLLALAIFLAAPPAPGGTDRPSRRRALPALAAAALLAAALGAAALLPGLSAAARSIRGPGGGMGESAAALQPLAPVRLKELLADGLVADWSKVAAAPGVKDYPYFPSLTPGRVAWILVVAGLVAGGPLRIASAALAVFGVLLALGGATPVFHVAVTAFPPLASLRYPERHVTLAGFALATLAALGLARLDALSPKARRFVFPLLALLLLDRERTARRLSPMDEASVLTKPPVLLEPLLGSPPGAPPHRIFHRDLYAPVPAYDLSNLESANDVGRATLLPAYASLFGAGYVFEKDYDLSLSVEAFEWQRLLAKAVPKPGPFPLRLVRAAGASAVLASERGEDGKFQPRLRRIGDAVSPFRFAARVVASDDARRVFARFLEEEAAPDTAYVDADVPGFPAAPGTGRVLSLSDRPSALTLDVEVGGAEGFLMLWRLREAVAEATVDGRRAEVAPMAFGFAGVRVPEGRHVVVLRPDTRWVKIGVLISAAAAVLAVVLARRGRGGDSA